MRSTSGVLDRYQGGGAAVTHAETVIRGRKEHVRPAVCPGELTPVRTRRHWAKGVAEQIYQCQDCGAVLGLVGETVDWTMNASDWSALD